MSKTFIAALSCGLASAAFPLSVSGQDVVLTQTTALRIEVDHRVRSHIGASVTGHLTEPVFLIDHEVIPAGTIVQGTVHHTHAASTKEHVRRLLAADFTPPRVPDITFESIALPVAGGTARIVAIRAPAVRTDASVLTLGTQKQKQTIKVQIGDAIRQGKQSAKQRFGRRQIRETVEKWALGQLPYHPEMIWTGTRFNADLADPVTIPDTPHTMLPVADLGGHLPEGALHARLLSPISSETAKRGDPVEAMITQPLLSPDKTKVFVPEGTLLHGMVMEAKSARSFGRNGNLRFAFRKLDLPEGNGEVQSADIHGKLSAAETAAGQHVTMDEEGQVKASDGPAKYAEPLLLGALALAAHPDDDHGPGGSVNPGATTVASNGFGLIARVVSLTTRDTNVLQGFAYYSLGKSIYFHYVDKGHETTFPRDTEIQVTLSER